MKALKYSFGTYDPAEFTGEQLTFSATPTGLLLADGLHIEGIHFFNDEKFGLVVNKVRFVDACSIYYVSLTFAPIGASL